MVQAVQQAVAVHRRALEAESFVDTRRANRQRQEVQESLPFIEYVSTTVKLGKPHLKILDVARWNYLCSAPRSGRSEFGLFASPVSLCVSLCNQARELRTAYFFFLSHHRWARFSGHRVQGSRQRPSSWPSGLPETMSRSSSPRLSRLFRCTGHHCYLSVILSCLELVKALGEPRFLWKQRWKVKLTTVRRPHQSAQAEWTLVRWSCT